MNDLGPGVHLYADRLGISDQPAEELSAFSEPRTWTAGEVVTASIMNLHVRDQFRVVRPAYIYSNQNASNWNSPGAFPFLVSVAGSSGITYDGVNPSFIPQIAGVYVWGASAGSSTSPNSTYLHLLKNGVAVSTGLGAVGISGTVVFAHFFNGTTDTAGWLCNLFSSGVESITGASWMVRVAS